MDSRKFATFLAKRISALRKVAKSRQPNNPAMIERHNEKVTRANRYLSELNSLKYYSDLPIIVVSKNSFDEIVHNSDFASLEEIGEFYIIAYIRNDKAPTHKEFHIAFLVPLATL